MVWRYPTQQILEVRTFLKLYFCTFHELIVGFIITFSNSLIPSVEGYDSKCENDVWIMSPVNFTVRHELTQDVSENIFASNDALPVAGKNDDQDKLFSQILESEKNTER